MQRLKDSKLGTRLALESATLATVVATGLMILADHLSDRHHALHESYSIITAQLAQSATEYVVNKDRLGLQALLQDVVSELPALVESYRHDGDFDVTRTRELTDRCFRMASGAGEDLAQTLTSIDDAAGGSAPDASVTETLGQ